jgi:hypothetical protein
VKKILICYGAFNLGIEGNTICPLGDAAGFTVPTVTLEMNLSPHSFPRKIKNENTLLPNLLRK